MTDLANVRMLCCKVCGYQNKQLFQHIRSVHKMSTADYRKMYGCDEIMQIGFAPPKQSTVNKHNSATVKLSYINIQKQLANISALSANDTRDLLIHNNYYLKFLGKSKQKSLRVENIQLYKSVYENTRILDNLVNIHPTRGFTYRIKFIVEYNYNIDKIRCICGKYTFSTMCRGCVSKTSTIDWYKRKYPDSYMTKYEHRLISDKLLGYSYSKVSQKLFNSIYYKLRTTINDVMYYGELNSEWKIFLTDDERQIANQSMYCLDFKYKDKNIEFDSDFGRFPKDSRYVAVRDSILKARGMSILRVDEREYVNNHDETLNKCINFINDN